MTSHHRPVGTNRGGRERSRFGIVGDIFAIRTDAIQGLLDLPATLYAKSVRESTVIPAERRELAGRFDFIAPEPHTEKESR
jgi:hypothetical protein